MKEKELRRVVLKGKGIADGDKNLVKVRCAWQERPPLPNQFQLLWSPLDEEGCGFG